MTEIIDTPVKRRSFLKWSGAVAGTTALVGTSSTFLGMPGKADTEGRADADKIVWSACTVNCGSRCPVKLQVKDNVIVRVLPDQSGTNEMGTQSVRACVRGRSIRHRIYNPDRLKTPLKRVEGTKRGEEKWEEISWEQAITEITDMMKALKDVYKNNEVFYINYGTGTLGGAMSLSWPPDAQPFARMMNCWGGYLDHYSDYSTTQITQAYPYFYGGWMATNSFDDAKNSKLQVMFGNNPVETRMSGGGQVFVTQMTKKKSGVRTIIIDPRLSDSVVTLADEWVPIRPGTDSALIAGMIHVMLKENLHDQEFLDKYCIGFDEDHMPAGAPKNASYRAYIEGAKDGIEKTPEWAANICGVPAQKIVQLAKEIANAKPCAISQGWGVQRRANGENECRAVFLLACVTGNFGIEGGGTGGREGGVGLPITKSFNAGVIPGSDEVLVNPSEKIISCFSWLDAIEHGPEMDTFNSSVGVKPAPGVRAMKVPVDENGVPENTKLEVPIKMIWNYGSNSLVNQTGDNNKSVEILQDDTKAELIVTCDIQYTVTCRYSDYILPGTSAAEEDGDIHPGENGTPMAYGIVSSQAIEPLYECKSVFDICTMMAEKLGVAEKFTGGKTRQEWVEQMVEDSRAADTDVPEAEKMPEYEVWKEQGLFRRTAGSVIAGKDFRDDPEANPLNTPSGKIEIYSDRLAAMAEKWYFDAFRDAQVGDVITPLPEYVPTWEGPEDAKENEKYPLQIIGHHYKQRTHSSYGNVDWMQEAHPQSLWINPADAAERGIENDDLVYAYNDRGTVLIKAKVTPRIAPGVLSLPQGAWFNPDPSVPHPEGANTEYPVDTAGSTNTLTSLHPSPLAKGNAVHTTLVQVVKK